MYIVIVIMPIIGAITSVVIGEAYIQTTGVMIISGIMAIYGIYEIAICGNRVEMEISEWMEIVDWGIRVDALTAVMVGLVCIVSGVVHVYGGEYMREDPTRGRFMIYISIFTSAMLILVTADNYLQLFVGWEGVGVCSYLLIGYWGERIAASKAGVQAMIVNRIGDMGLAIGIVMMYKEYGTFEYEVINAEGGIIKEIVVWLLWIGAMGKSAQIGLHIWLPNAMEGPTPVSALIHAATMVTAGVYMIVRASPVIGGTEVMVWIGGLTIIIGGSIGMVQMDMKKVIAYSTLSQLGYMTLACGLGAYTVAVYHIITHGVFKALLFMGAGIVIHSIGEQDMRKMGGLRRIMPGTYMMVMIGSMALMGVPFMSGYYSKEPIMEIAYAEGGRVGGYGYGCGVIGVMITGYYSARLMRIVFIRGAGEGRRVIEGAHEEGKMVWPLMILAIGGVIMGYMIKDGMIGVGTDMWGNEVYVERRTEGEFIDWKVKIIPVGMMTIGIIMGWRGEVKEKRVVRVLSKRWMIDKVYREWIVQPIVGIGYKGTYKIDRGVMEWIGPTGIYQELTRIRGYNQTIYQQVGGIIVIVGVMMIIG